MSSVKPDAEGFDENCLVKSPTPPAPPGKNPEKTTETNEDYLMIPSATTPKQLRVNKFCGNTINAQTVIADAPGPYVLQFHTDEKYKAADDKSREGGFNIKYKIQ